jgi:hypothetical protein
MKRLSRVREQSSTRAVQRTNLATGKTFRYVEEVRETRREHWSGKRILVRALLLYLSVATVVSFSLFIQFETVKQGGFSCMGLQSLKAWDQYDACNQAQLERVNQIERTTNTIGFLAPWIGWAYSTYLSMEHDRLKWAFETSQLGRAADQKFAAAQALKNQSNAPWIYEYKTVSISESNVTGISQVTSQMSGEGYHLVDSYHTKINGVWMVVETWELVVKPPGP